MHSRVTKRNKEDMPIGEININLYFADDYYGATVDVVIQILKNRLKGIPAKDLEAQADQWDLWTNNWCQFSFGSFLRSTLDGIKTQLVYDDKLQPDDPTLNQLEKYLPWPEAAITAYSVFNYTLAEDVSLTAEVQEGMGKWWSNDMHSLEGGLSALPNAFAGPGGVEQHITYNRMVTKVVYNWDGNQVKSVEVHGVITSSGEPFVVKGTLCHPHGPSPCPAWNRDSQHETSRNAIPDQLPESNPRHHILPRYQDHASVQEAVLEYGRSQYHWWIL